MRRLHHQQNIAKFKLFFIYGMSSSLLISSMIQPIHGEVLAENREKFVIASLPIDDPTLKEGINEIQVPETTTTPANQPTIKPPIAPNPPANTTIANTRDANNISNNRAIINNQAASNNTNANNRNTNTTNNRRNSRNRQRVIATNSTSRQPTYRDIDFVNIPFGILSPGDFQSEGRYVHFYRFEGQENQVIQLRLTGSVDQRRSNNLSLRPYMFLFDPDNNVILRRSSSDNSKSIRDASIFAKLPKKGVYTIAVTSQNPGDVGRYTIALRNDRASYVEDDFTELTASSPTLKNGSPYNVTKLEGKKGQLVSIRVDSVLEEFSPFIVLLDAQGRVVSSDNDREGRYSALIDRAKLPADGTYYVVVTSKTPNQSGRYRLTVF
ncbi:peptidase [Nostoc sp. CENA543]|uniref:PPC domain-containing protein n=1 Tax=Nostoc sp. CENA543 TaxID=1869241 RepID=UPI000CA34ADE|nr:PPC domain-containing protein [Nostoc sp. CENA543]AUT00310.1 peptidase [Nostoc sp. CENA543]